MIFVAYSHVDMEWCDDLLTMAAPLTRYGGLQIFSDTDIAAGALWRSTIQKSLDKATVAVLLVSRHFLESKFIMDVELPYILNARNARGLQVLWVLVSECLYEKTALASIQAALPTDISLEELSKAKKSAALKTLCRKIDDAWKASERPSLDPALDGMKVQKRMDNLKLLTRPVTRRVEIFVRADNSGAWYHQGAVLSGKVACTCHFGAETTKPDTGFHIVAITTDAEVPHQHGKPTKPLPSYRTRSKEVRVIRA